ncbi:MAG: DUF2281 domain-containing protein [Methylococcaceae bacterium]|nr:DUF2281 domain-containing protein [Methylococcaceae bacterium]
MINIAINNESLYKTAQTLGHHYNAEETIENALQIYIQYLQQNKQTPTLSVSQNKQPRKFGQHRGLIEISEDFDEPLPDSFWLGDDE